MMRSLFSGVSGLKVHQTKMDVIGNNIANVNTVGFKSSSVTFTDIFYQTSQSASGPNAATGAGGQNAKQIGLGAAMGAIAVNITGQGGSQRTDNPFDLMINGDSFFIVNKGGTNYFTKAGNFNVDEAGTLVNSAGYPVMGWSADSDGKIQKERVGALHVMASENMSTPPEATTESTFFGNINEEDDMFKKDPPNDYIPIQMSFFDSLGYEFQAMFHVRRGTRPATGDVCEYTMDLASLTKEGTVIAEATKDATTGAYTYIPGFTQQTLRFHTGEDPIPANGNVAAVEPGGLISIGTTAGVKEVTFDFSAITGGFVGTQTADSLGALKPINVNMSSITNYGSASTLDTKTGNSESVGKGKAPGEMSRLGVQTDGKIVASYTNGDQRILGQIAVAKFANAAGLEKIGENLYAETLNSGKFNGIGEDITADGGKFTTGVLEMSNVDLSTEFVEMITTQRGFQANSRIITVSDSMLEELINLKR